MSLSASWQDTGLTAPLEARRSALRAARRHSRRVRVLRILLPVVALMGIGALFALTQLGLPLALDLSNARLSITPNAVIMEHPNFTGFAGEGREYSVSAARAVQSLANPDRVQLEAISATIDIADQGVTSVAAGSGKYDHAAGTLRLEGDVTLDSSQGYGLRMREVDIDFNAGTMRSDKPVTVIYADSEIVAERLLASDNGKRIRFEGGVHTTIMPPKRAAAETPAAAAPAAPAKVEE